MVARVEGWGDAATPQSEQRRCARGSESSGTPGHGISRAMSYAVSHGTEASGACGEGGVLGMQRGQVLGEPAPPPAEDGEVREPDDACGGKTKGGWGDARRLSAEGGGGGGGVEWSGVEWG